ncbi:hypothetical protein ACSBLW_14130 [Thioclava sp. FR2]|uniref:hypothetical protein n=1 Tax=Thioclava sp. FR2 TaxID=3445780 RepID=UPI003EBE2B7D
MWYDRIIDDPVNLVSTLLGVAGVVLGIIPLILLIFERRKSRILDQTIKHFAILEKIEEQKSAAIDQKTQSEKEAEALNKHSELLKSDIENRLPNAAMVAYYKNTIPHLETQILEYGQRLTHMRQYLNELEGKNEAVSKEIAEILSKQISESIGARRDLEQQQIYLVVCTAVMSVTVSVMPYPFSALISLPLAYAIVLIVTRLIRTARFAYPENEILKSPIFNSKVLYGFTILAFILLAALLWLLFFPF